MALRFDFVQTSVFSRGHTPPTYVESRLTNVPILQVIELSDNAIKARGGKALAKALAKCGILILMGGSGNLGAVNFIPVSPSFFAPLPTTTPLQVHQAQGLYC